MNKEGLKRNIQSGIVTSAVVIALIFISIIQYKWLITSTEKDLTELYRNINFKIYRSISFELENEFYGYKELFFNEYISTNDIKKKMETLYGGFSKTISFVKENKLYEFNGEQWSVTQSSLAQARKFGYLFPDENSLVKFYFPIKSETPALGIIQFDLNEFYTNLINSDKELLSSEYELKWYFKRPKDSYILNDKDYKYSPFVSLKNMILNKETLWLFGVSFYMDIFKPREPEDPNILMRSRGYNPLEDHNLFVDIQVNGKSIIKTKETQITIQWLATLFLLLGMGISYLFILNQIRNLKQLRDREKIFVATITHELRTPLTVITSAADNIQQGILKPERLIQYGGLIKEQSKRLSSMVEGILLFSRLEGKAEKPPELKPLAINNIFTEIKEIHPEVESNINFNELVLSDKDTLLHILNNLIENSKKHAYIPGEITPIRIKAHIQLPNKLLIIVEDDGMGISKYDKKHIFKPFYRSNRSYQDQIKGSGLGLFIAHSKARLIGGELTLESPYERINGEVKKGCRFTLSLPYKTLEKEAYNV
ncbi:MAG: HAMP domain-containing histidine kinase [Spirochaetales bacterium]|nr:HAMP domain-containing histidine kinase [Spirochaetales bacterium]